MEEKRLQTWRKHTKTWVFSHLSQTFPFACSKPCCHTELSKLFTLTTLTFETNLHYSLKESQLSIKFSYKPFATIFNQQYRRVSALFHVLVLELD